MPEQPTLFLIAGPNGAGKTTLASTFLPEFTNIKEFVNADLIAKGLSPFNAETALISAGRILLERVDQLIAERHSFALETTLSGKGYMQLLEHARLAGFRIELYYIFLDSAELSAERVKIRVGLGGHDVPAHIIMRRYVRSLLNLFCHYLPLVDNWTLIDNSRNSIVVIAEKQTDDLRIHIPTLYEFLKRTYGRK